MDMANAAVEVPVTVLTAEVMEGPTAWPSVVARLRMPRSSMRKRKLRRNPGKKLSKRPQRK